MSNKEQEQPLNKFEKTRLLAARALELAEGDAPKVPLDEQEFPRPILTKDYVRIAEKELDAGELELDVYRQMAEEQFGSMQNNE